MRTSKRIEKQIEGIQGKSETVKMEVRIEGLGFFINLANVLVRSCRFSKQHSSHSRRLRLRNRITIQHGNIALLSIVKTQ
jgi:hypothetical protein